MRKPEKPDRKNREGEKNRKNRTGKTGRATKNRKNRTGRTGRETKTGKAGSALAVHENGQGEDLATTSRVWRQPGEGLAKGNEPQEVLQRKIWKVPGDERSSILPD